LAKSGTTNFIEHIKSGNMNLIGQFGVGKTLFAFIYVLGFYSAFLVANKVQVFSKHSEDLGYLWESSAANSFTISQDETYPLRGTTVVLHLKQEAQDFANEKNLKSMIQRYSEFITFPIYLQVTKQVTKEVPIEEDPSETISVESNDPEEQKEIDEARKKASTKKVTENVIEYEQQNLQKPIWLRDKTEIKLEEY
jgi:HSP90 family molecular chaperone